MNWAGIGLDIIGQHNINYILDFMQAVFMYLR